MKPVVRQADLVMAVAAARTTWIMTDVDQQLSLNPLIGRPEPAEREWTFLPGLSLSASQHPSTLRENFWCVN